MDQTQVILSSSLRLEEDVSTCSPLRDVRQGTIIKNGVATKVLVLMVRLASPQKTTKQQADVFILELLKPVGVWKKCNHSNIVQFQGIVMLNGCIPSLVTLNYENGFYDQYLSKNPDFDKLRLVVGVAAGLQYLHAMDPPMIHQGVRCENILVNDSGEGCLTAVGTSLIHHPCSPGCDPLDLANRSTAPEVLRATAEDGDISDRVMTPASDVYSYGMTVLEIFSRRVPFYRKSHYSVTLDALKSEEHHTLDRTDYPDSEVPGKVWMLILSCVSEEPSARPSMDVVVRELQAIMP